MSGHLERLLEQATPGSWEVDAADDSLDVRAPEHQTATIWIHLAGPWTMGTDADSDVKARALADAALIALAPDTTRLLIDMAVALENLREPEWVGNESLNALLARFAALDTEEGT